MSDTLNRRYEAADEAVHGWVTGYSAARAVDAADAAVNYEAAAKAMRQNTTYSRADVHIVRPIVDAALGRQQ